MIDANAYKQVLGHFASGVTVTTVADGQGGIVGFTASAFSALSLDPPLVLVCLSYASECYQPLLDERRFAVHILREDQGELAWLFADRTIDKNQLATWRFDERGYAVLEQRLALIECRLQAEHAGGDHAIFIGEVEMLAAESEGKPLLYYRGQLGGPAVF